jgi:REP element-mobilizing transposase RayT
VVFSTKNREPLISSEWAPRLYSYMGGIFRETGTILLAAGGMPDHVHLLISMSKQVSVADLVRTVKTNSSSWIHKTLANQGGFSWQSGYGAFSVSLSNVEEVVRYIENQAEHHRTKSYQEEFVAFLKRHNLPYDERYLWE